MNSPVRQSLRECSRHVRTGTGRPGPGRVRAAFSSTFQGHLQSGDRPPCLIHAATFRGNLQGHDRPSSLLRAVSFWGHLQGISRDRPASFRGYLQVGDRPASLFRAPLFPREPRPLPFYVEIPDFMNLFREEK